MEEIIIGSSTAVVAIASVWLASRLRVVVSTNDVDIVQSAKRTVSYGKGEAAGNVYYKWPAWLPRVGVTTIRLPVSVFSLALEGYAGYDKGRVPFLIDTIAFFRVTDPNTAAQRISSIDELRTQLEFILKGAFRTILASSEIEEILEGRSKFGEMFTKEVDEQLKQWGVQTVKTIELMDIRDATGSQVIQNIMAKKKSLIEMQSRTEVANNLQAAQIAEVNAQQIVEVRKREAEQLIGQRAAQRDQEIGIANQKATQAVREEERITAEKNMAVAQVNTVRQAEISRQAYIVAADQSKQVAVINAEGIAGAQVAQAEGQKKQAVLQAEGNLQSTLLAAQGIEAKGKAQGLADQAVQVASVAAQVTLAKEIGGNKPYQEYLVSIRQVEANQVVGVEQAKALVAAQIKIIANTGNMVEGVKSVMDLLTPKGGTQIGAALEALSNTEIGKEIINRVTRNGEARQ